MEATVDPQPGGPDWMPITPKRGALFHAETHSRPKLRQVPAPLALKTSEQPSCFEPDRVGHDEKRDRFDRASRLEALDPRHSLSEPLGDFHPRQTGACSFLGNERAEVTPRM